MIDFSFTLQPRGLGRKIAAVSGGEFMLLKYYVPLSLLFFVGVLSLAHYYGVPVLPFAIILFIAETALGFRCSNHKVGDKVAAYVDAVKPHPQGQAHRAH